MVIARSTLTAQGQISVPSEVRRKLGLGPGSVLEWDEAGETIFVRRDDPQQVEAAEAFVGRVAWISHLFLAESTWVLSSVYGLGAVEIATAG